MRLTAIVPTSDRPALLQEALTSVMLQSHPVDEVIVVNDGVQPVALDNATVVRCGPYAGPSAARNLGAARATGDVLLFLDDDDLWSTDHVARLVETIDGHDLAASAITQIRRRGGTVVRTPPSRLDTTDWLTCNAGIQGSNFAIRREALAVLQGFDESLGCCEDMDLMIRAADSGLRYAAHARATVSWRIHDGPRLTDPRPGLRHAHRSFLAVHGGRMSASEVARFRERTLTLFGVDPGPVPTLVWVLGPPGAGKTTWATRRARGRDRVMDFEESLIWLDGADQGVRQAKRHLAAAIRATEERRPDGARRLFATPAYFMPEDLGPLGVFEHLVCLVPSLERWEVQLLAREGYLDPRHRQEHARWLTKFGTGALAAPGGWA